MPLKRYRVVGKSLCPSCLQAKNEGQIIKDCSRCSFFKYRNVTRLVKFTSFLDTKYPDWVWFRVYEYIEGQDNGRELAVFRNWHKNYQKINGRWVFMGSSREVPSREQL